MKSLYINLTKRLVKMIVGIWILFIVFIEITLYFDPQGDISQTIVLASVMSIFTCVIYNSRSGWINFLQTISPNTNYFWLIISNVNVAIILVNTVFLFIAAQGLGLNAEVTNHLAHYKADLFWIFLLIYTFTFILSLDSKAMLINQSKNPSKQVWVTLFSGILSFVCLAIFIFLPRLYGYLFLELILIPLFFFTNTYALSTLFKTHRYKLTGFFMSIILMLGLVSYIIKSSCKGACDSGFMSKSISGRKLEQNRVTIDQIKTPTAWVLWFGSVKDKTDEVMIQASTKLNELCPPHPVDYPIVIECFEKSPASDGESFKLNPDAKLALKLMNQTNEYAILIGLLKARGTKDKSKELIEKIESFMNHPRLSAVAEKSLISLDSTEPNWFRVQIQIIKE